MKRILGILGIFGVMAGLVNAQPDRSQGLSMHMLPMGVAEPEGQKWGFVVTEIFRQRHQKPEETFQSFEEIRDYFRSLPRKTQGNGLWIVVAHPDAYSETEKQFFESVRQGCLKEKILLFVCRGSQLPDGWIEGAAFSLDHSDTMYLAKKAFDLGWQSFKEGELDAALKDFNRATTIDPNFAPAYFTKAHIYSVQDKLALATENYRKSIAWYPQYSQSYGDLGLDLLSSGKPYAAFAMLKEVIEIDPANGAAHVNMARYYFEMKDYSNCWKHIGLAEKQQAHIDPEFLKTLKAKMPRPK